MKKALSLLAVSSLALFICVQCSEPVHQCGLDITCGDPEGLSGRIAPGGPNQKGQDSNNTMVDQDAGTMTLCTPIANADGGGCTVSFTKDILGARLGAAGLWGCAKAGGCHAPGDGVAPKMDTNNAAQTYSNMFNTGNMKPYINPCSKDITQSEIYPNLSGTTAGTQMPLGGPYIDASDIDNTVKSWVTCGAPLN